MWQAENLLKASLNLSATTVASDARSGHTLFATSVMASQRVLVFTDWMQEVRIKLVFQMRFTYLECLMHVVAHECPPIIGLAFDFE